MIEKASNLQDRHQEKSEETNVMWESREIKKQKQVFENSNMEKK